jgi:hypothetical protein
MPVIPTPTLGAIGNLKHFNQHQTGYLAVKRTPRITTYLKQVSTPAGFRRIVRSRQHQ